MPVDDNDVARILNAFRFAAERHRDQRRKGGEASPYINHLIDVAGILWDDGGVRDIVTIEAAILHDTVEDTETTASELRELFGEETAAVVLEVTDDKSLPKEVRKRLQVEHADKLSPRAALIKIADKISNIRDIVAAPPVNWNIERRRRYVMWGCDVVDRIRGLNPGLERRFDKICEIAGMSFDREEGMTTCADDAE